MDAVSKLNEKDEFDSAEWQPVCSFDDLVDNVGACALLGNNQVAIFKLSNDDLFAIDNYDPFSDANVLSRGIIGDLKGQAVVASPIYKQHFNLATGQCLEDESVSIPTYRISVIDGTVHIAD